MVEVCHMQGLSEPKFEELDHYFRVTLYHGVHAISVKIPWQQDIIEYLTKNQAISTKEASKLWNVTERTASTRLKAMVENGLVREVSTNPYDPKKKFILIK
ncbi:hypothetical protein LEAN103870_06975 [Legionella anisa]|nr:hypothetical protein Lani_2948 [Legionella anisa]UAK81460.1 winged helix-turn-helix transcriptional regulator [Legionella anisa]